MDPTRFAFGLMTRSKAITYDNLALRAPEFVKLTDKVVARETQAAGLRGRHRQARGADVPAVPAARHDAGQSRGGVADVPIFRGRRHADRLAHGASTARRAIGGAGLMFTEMTCVVGRCAHHAGLHRALERRPGGGLEAHRRFRPRQLGGEILPPAWPCRAEGRDQADVGGHGPAAAARRAGRSWRPRPCPITRTARCRAK